MGDAVCRLIQPPHPALWIRWKDSERILGVPDRVGDLLAIAPALRACPRARLGTRTSRLAAAAVHLSDVALALDEEHARLLVWQVDDAKTIPDWSAIWP